MKKQITLLLVLFTIVATSQTLTQNYIKTVSYKVATPTPIIAPTMAQAATNVTYFDGLGRPVLQVAYRQSAAALPQNAKDIITPIQYDAY